ncbi:hypothetical protein [Micromonospora humida]|uniref:hypothetical protein n=1 Tax=Micromonospora humida TaxID=2809018 RepID=UPI00341A3041
MTAITINKLTEAAALFRHYDGEAYPQPCYVHLDLEDGQVHCDYTASIGGAVPIAIHDRRTLTWQIPPLTADSANRLMAEIAPLAQRVLDGASIEFNGSSHIGTLDDDAQDASDEIETIASSWADDNGTDVVSAVDAYDWYSEGDDPADELGLTADTTDEQLAAIEKAAEADITAAAEGTIVVQRLATYLEGRRGEMRAAVRESLEEIAESLADLVERRATLVRQIAAWGTDSDRQIGALADKSHTWVQKVRAGEN